MDLNKLREPFKPEDLEWRVQQAGESNGRLWARVVAYVDNRAIMDRLDEVVGPENWRNEYHYGPNGAVMCGLSLRIKHTHEGVQYLSEWVTKWDGSENTDIEAVKGGLSGAMKRAAVQWGIGRYLYDLPPGYAEIVPEGQRGRYFNKKPQFGWNPPKLPAWALPPVPLTPGQQAKPLASDPPAQQPERAAAVAEAVRTLPVTATIVLPGSKTNLMGYGGKRIVDVPIEQLPAIREKLKMANSATYDVHIAAIDEYLEAMRTD